MMQIISLRHPSPLGVLVLESDGTALTRIRLPGEPGGPVTRAPNGGPCAAAAAQLDEYFAGVRKEFDLPIAPAGTPFQRRVWSLLRAIPWGATISYAELARRAGNRAACRAVGAANGRNPLPIVVPCHRVIGSDGRLTGYAGGLAAKQFLLELERKPAAGAGRPDCAAAAGGLG